MVEDYDVATSPALAKKIQKLIDLPREVSDGDVDCTGSMVCTSEFGYYSLAGAKFEVSGCGSVN